MSGGERNTVWCAATIRVCNSLFAIHAGQTAALQLSLAAAPLLIGDAIISHALLCTARAFV